MFFLLLVKIMLNFKCKKLPLEQDFEDATLLCIHSDELENIQAKFYAFYKHCLSLVLLAS